jgi:hypothetical protein
MNHWHRLPKTMPYQKLKDQKSAPPVSVRFKTGQFKSNRLNLIQIHLEKNKLNVFHHESIVPRETKSIDRLKKRRVCMKRVSMVIRLVAFLTIAGVAMHAHAQEQDRHAALKAAIQSCVNDEKLNPNKITFPAFVRGRERPELSDDQRALLRACRQAGRLPSHHHDHWQSRQNSEGGTGGLAGSAGGQ